MSGPTYTYTPDTPQASTPMNITAPLIRENFQAINELIAVNHATFGDSNFGKHYFISMPNTTNPGADSEEITMYTAVTGSPNPCEIFIQYPSGTTGSISAVQISNEIVTSTGTGTSGGDASQGWCSFPSGVNFRWGTFSSKATAQTVISLSSGTYCTVQQYPAAVSPTSSGCLMPTGMTVYIGLESVPSVHPQEVPTAFYGYVSSSTEVSFNYLLMGT
jgi:hypothetical protein